MEKMTQRDAFWNRIHQLQKDNRELIVISADMGAPALDQVRRDFPGQFINAGIAEQNAILIGSGLALLGKHVFCYAIAPFITLRCLEQIRVNCGIMHMPMTIVGVSAGFGYIDAGPTHHSTEDIAIMRSLPGMTLHCVSDNHMAAYFAQKSCKMPNANYVRLDREPLPDLYNASTVFEDGCAVLKKGSTYIVSNGCMVHMALEVARQLEKKGLDVGVIDLYEIPIKKEQFLKSIKGADRLITLEEHYYAGGLGSAVQEVLMDNEVFLPVKRLALDPAKGYCYNYGEREAIRGYFGLDLPSVTKKVEQIVAKNALTNV